MNIEEYISSGVIEAYVLGIATEDELREIEQLMPQYPELVAAIREQEEVLIKYAQKNATAPPPQLKQTIWQALSGEVLNEAEPTIVHPPDIKPVPEKNRVNRGKYTLAASVVLFIVSAAGNVWMMNRNKEMMDTVAILNRRQEELILEKNAATVAVQRANETLQVLSLPALLKITLAGVGTHTAHSAMLYWDGATGDVFLDLHKMPDAPEGKQYQLWAIVDGKPVDAGMYNAFQTQGIHKMKTIAKAEMFAVTIENAGGSAVPTLDQMVVAGKTS